MKRLLTTAMALSTLGTVGVAGIAHNSYPMEMRGSIEQRYEQTLPGGVESGEVSLTAGDLKATRVVEGFQLYARTYQIMIRGKTFELDGLEHYKDSEQVVAALMPRDKTAVEYMRKTHKLPAFSVATAGQYLGAFGQDMANEKPKPAGLNLEPFFMWCCFVANAHSDDNLTQSVEHMKIALAKGDVRGVNDAHSELIASTPTNEKNAEVTKYIDSIVTGSDARSARLAFNSYYATKYAERYATSRNPKYSYYAGNDCTNFASQILKAGYQQEDSVWFYKTGMTSVGAVYPSRAWRVADDFARHWGITNHTYNWATFASRVTPGSFVGLAYPSGQIFHIGYVTKMAGYATDNGVTYRSFAIAQHSHDYYGWVHGDQAARGWRTPSYGGHWVTR